MAENRTSVSHLNSSGTAVLHHLGQNPEKYAEFLRFQGRVFKHSLNVSLVFFAQNSDAQFIASQGQWERLGYSVQHGAVVAGDVPGGVSHGRETVRSLRFFADQGD